MAKLSPTERTRIHRSPRRAATEASALAQVLDEGLVCHVGFAHHGEPVVVPTAYARDGNRLLLHGSTRSRMLATLADGAPLCVTVTLLDGLVLARSVFHHSMNYRSAVIFAHATPVRERQRKLHALRAITDHLVPGRWAHARPPSEQELAATAVLELPLTEASVKIRTGPPEDDADDYELDVWAGTIPTSTVFDEPVADPAMPDDRHVPAHARHYRRSTRPADDDQ